MDTEIKIVAGTAAICALVFLAILLPRMLRDRSRWNELTPEQQQVEMEKLQLRKRRWFWIEIGVKIIGSGLLIGFISAINIWNSEETARQSWLICGAACVAGTGAIIFGCTRK